jgi:plastocyanin
MRALLTPFARCAGLIAVAAVALVTEPRAQLSAAAQGTGGGGSLRGRVDIRRVASVPVPRPGVAELSAPLRPEPLDLPRAVVFLEAVAVGDRSALRAGPRTPTGRPRIDQRNETFSPHVLAVDVGTLVDFPNNDQTFHNVFSLSPPRRFDLGRYGRGKSASVRFDRPGIVRVFCDIHSHMSAYVLVFNHPFHAMTDDDGRYRIDNIPPGTYTVTAWHEGAARDTRSITIPPAGSIIDVDLLVQ